MDFVIIDNLDTVEPISKVLPIGMMIAGKDR